MLTKMTVAAALLASTAGCYWTGTNCQPGQDIIDLINKERAAVGCPPVQGDNKLYDAAIRHTTDMRDNGVTNHTGSDGSTAVQRIQDAGFAPLSKSGEVMYWNIPATSAAATVDWWMNSPGHKAILLDCDFTHIGVGVLYPGGAKWYAVADFGRH